MSARPVAVLSAVLGFLLAAGLAPGVAAGDPTSETNWTNSAGGAWTNPTNWDNGVPDSNAAAVFNLGTSSAYTVSFSTSAAINTLRGRTGTVDFDLGGQTLNILDVLSLGWEAGDDVYLRPANGSLLSVWSDIGHHTPAGSANGRMTLTGTAVSWVNSMDVTIARGSTGGLDVMDGASVTISRDAYVGNTGSGETHAANGTLNVIGTGSTFNTQRLTIGFGGSGAQAEATVNVTDHAALSCTAGQIAVGAGGTGHFNVSGGSTVSSAKGTSPSFSSGVIGATNAGVYGVGVVTLNDAGTNWTQDGSLSVGFTADGTLNVEGGATIYSQWGHVARRAGSVGHATVTGSGSLWVALGQMYVGGEASPANGGLGAGGQGRLDVRDGGLVQGGLWTELWDQGTVDVTGGGRMMVGTGLIPSTQDRLYVGGGGLLIGTGTVLGTVVNLSDGNIAPGHSVGTLTVDALELQQGGMVEFEVGGLAAGTDYDVLHVNGSATLGGTLSLVFINGFLPKAGQMFDLIPTGQGYSGEFDEVDIEGLDPGWDFSLDNVDGTLQLVSDNDATPEPATLSLLALGGAALLLRRRRHA